MIRNEIASQLAAEVPRGQAHAQAVGAAPATVNNEPLELALARAQAAAHSKRLNGANGICADALVASTDKPNGPALEEIFTAVAGDPEVAIVLLARAIKLRPVVAGPMRPPAHVTYRELSGVPCLFRTRSETMPSKILYLKANPARIASQRQPTKANRPGLCPTHPLLSQPSLKRHR